jgi:hypothetical protein
MRAVTFSSTGVSFCTSDWLTVVAIVVGLGVAAFIASAVLRRRAKAK